MCYDEGTLQELLDGEYQGDIQALWSHLDACPECMKKYEILKKQETLVSNALNQGYIKAEKPMPLKELNRERHYKRRKHQMKKVHWGYKAATAAILAGVMIFTAPGAALAEEFLNIFRTQDVKAIAISPDDVSDIQYLFERGNGDVEIDNIGKFESVSNGERKELGVIENGDPIRDYLSGAKILTPVSGQKYGNADLIPEIEVRFTLSVPAVNELLKSMGNDQLFPEDLDQKMFSIKAGRTAFYQIENTEDKQGSLYATISELPEIGLPKGVDMKQILGTLKQTGLLPANLTEKIAGIEDLETVMPIPYLESEETRKEILLNGSKAIVIESKEGTSFRIFMKQGEYLYSFSGYDINLEETLKIIETME